MPQVSRRPLKKEVYKRIFELLLKVVSEPYEKKAAQKLLEDFLTPTEKIMLAKRLAIAVLLAKDFSYEAIGEIVKVSRPTIARVSTCIRYKGEGYKEFTERVLREEKIARFWEQVEDLVLGALAKGPKSDIWRHLYWKRKRENWKKKTLI